MNKIYKNQGYRQLELCLDTKTYTSEDDPYKKYKQILKDSGGAPKHIWKCYGYLMEATKSSPITQAQIAVKLGLKKENTAPVRDCIQTLRRLSFWICSGEDGCWETAFAEEFMTYCIKNLRTRIDSIAITMQLAEQSMRRFIDQAKIALSKAEESN